MSDPSPEEVRRVLLDLEEGERVRVILNDGSNHQVIVSGADLVSEGSERSIEAHRVRRVLID